MPNRDDELGGLWLRESEAAGKFLSGKLTIGDQEVEVIVFRNRFKREGERSPDYRVYRSQPREEQRQRLPERGQATHDASRRAGSTRPDDRDDEIQF